MLNDAFATFALTSEAGATYSNIDIKAAGQGLVAFFGSVAKVITQLGIQALTTLLSNIVNLLINCVCGVMDLFGNGVLGLLSINIGDSTSTFDLMLGAYKNFVPILQAFSFALLVLFLIFGIVKSMATMDGSGERPILLMARGIIAGVLIYWIVPIIHIIEKVFNTAYTRLLGAPGDLSFKFTNYATGIKTAFTNDTWLYDTNVDAFKSIALCVVMLFFMILIAIRYFKFLKEICERYIALGFLIILSPIAMPFLVQKSTRQTFLSFIRVLISQMLLLVLHIIFMRVFFSAMNGFEDTMETWKASYALSGASPTVAVLLWTVLIIAWLEIATKIDGYMNALGFSAAEAGAASIGSFASQVIEMLMLIGGRGSERDTRRSSRGVAGSNATPLRSNPDGSININSINAAVKSQGWAETASGADVGRSILLHASNIPKRVRDNIDVSSCRVSKGAISFKIKPTDGATESALVLVQKDALATNAPGGREVTIDGEKYVGYVTGAAAHRFYSSNGKFIPELQQKIGDSYGVYEIVRYPAGHKARIKQHTGVYNAVALERGTVAQAQAGLGSSLDASDAPPVASALNGYAIRQYAAVAEYAPGPELQATIETVGGVDYWVYDVHQTPSNYIRRNDDGSSWMQYGRCEEIIPPCRSGQEFSQTMFQQQFRDFNGIVASASDSRIVASDPNTGVICFTDGKSVYAAAPIFDYTVSPEQRNAFLTVISATNQAQYAVVEMSVEKETIDISQMDEPALLRRANEVFALREDSQAGSEKSRVFADSIDLSKALSEAFVRSAPPIVNVSRRKKENRK